MHEHTTTPARNGSVAPCGLDVVTRIDAVPPSGANAVTPTPAEHELPQLRELLDWSRRHGSRMGYFAALYFHTGRAVERGLLAGTFRDPAMLERVNDVFFGRYLLAFDAFRNGEPTSAAWTVSFVATRDRELTVLQHLMLGMNAHINFDLAVAVAEAVAPAQIAAFHDDFQTMNALFAELVGAIAADLATVWAPLRTLNRLLGREERLLVDVAMRTIRDEAWRNAVRLAGLDGRARGDAIEQLDTRAAVFAHLMKQPGWPAEELARAVRRGERGSVAEVIDDLLAR